jgi:transcriptional regulator with XRE-family HTH domain
MTLLDEVLSDPEARRVYEEELLIGEATETIGALLSHIGLNQRELARRMGVTAGRVSQVLSGRENLTLKTLSTMAWALGIRFGLTPEPMADRRGTPAAGDPPLPAWIDRLPTPQRPRFVATSVSVPSLAKPIAKDRVRRVAGPDLWERDVA